MTTLYRTRNCDPVKIIMKWLNNAGVEHCFYDLRKDGLKYWTIANWIKRPVWRKFLNRQDCTRSRLPREKKQEFSGGGITNFFREQPLHHEALCPRL